MKLSVLICSIPQRKEMLNALLLDLENQIDSHHLQNDVEILISSKLNISTGAKRNLLIKESQGDFVVFIDDDDEVFDYYLKEITDCISKHPKIDCIGINGIISFSGENPKKWFISKEYGRWYETNEVYFRTPNHISPVRKSIAEKVEFPDRHHGEDYAYSMGILPLLKYEEKIHKPLYHYKFNQTYQAPSSNEPDAPFRPAFR